MQAPKLRSRAPAVGCALIALAMGIGNAYVVTKPSQHQYEGKGMRYIANLLWHYELSYPQSPLRDLRLMWGERGYPYWLHEGLRTFGTTAGFEHCLEEKYVFLHPPVAGREGQIVLISAQTYGRSRNQYRQGVVKTSDRYYSVEFTEQQVRNFFEKAGRTIPKSIATARPPPPLDDTTIPGEGFWMKINRVFARQEWSGASAAQIATRRAGCFLLFALALTVAIVYSFWPVEAPRVAEPWVPTGVPRARRGVGLVVAWAGLGVLITMAFVTGGIGSERMQSLMHVAFPFGTLMAYLNAQPKLLLFLAHVLQLPAYGAALGYASMQGKTAYAGYVIFAIHMIGLALLLIIHVSVSF